MVAYFGVCGFMTGFVLASLHQEYAFIIFGIAAVALFASIAVRNYRT